MNNIINLSARLENVASFIPKGAQFADIGSDHGYLPCYVCLGDESAQAVAGEVNEGPFQSAQQTVRRYGLSKRIDVRLGSGLNVLNDGEVHLVVIAGMGGSLIKTILNEGKDHLNSVRRIIVQPNIGERHVRHWFYTHGYTIIDETMVEENGHIYEIIVGDRADQIVNLTAKQLLFGPHLLKQKPELFYQKWHYEHVKRQRIIDQMSKAALPDYHKIETFKRELMWIEEVLHDDNGHA